MHKSSYTSDELKGMQNSIVLLHGVFEKSFFDMIETRGYKKVFIMEGRPTLEAAKVACRELLKRKITPTVIADNMAGFLFYNKLVKEAWLAYKITEKRGAMCHIGASIVALLAKEHNVPLFCYKGDSDAEGVAKEKDVVSFNGVRVAPEGTETCAPLLERVPGKCFIIDEAYKALQS